jgi:hypothetical protein
VLATVFKVLHNCSRYVTVPPFMLLCQDILAGSVIRGPTGSVAYGTTVEPGNEEEKSVTLVSSCLRCGHFVHRGFVSIDFDFKIYYVQRYLP